MALTKDQIALGILRILLGFLLAWAFFDKLFGLGFATTLEKSWLAGTSPATGFLSKGVHGPLAGFFHSLAGNVVVDWLFMLGLLFIGLALILGIFMRLASYTGALLFFLMYLALIPPANNPFIDEHLIYVVAVLALGFTNSGKFLGLGEWWEKTALVQKFPIIA